MTDISRDAAAVTGGYAWQTRAGATLVGKDRTLFHFWAPSADAVSVVLEGGMTLAMEAEQDGWFAVEAQCGAGTRYRYQIEDLLVPDPASRAQAGDVHEPSIVIDPTTYHWQSVEWQGRPWHESVIYEVHVGTLGGFSGVEKLVPRLAALGVTAIELMPLSEFPGDRNWGYDGVLPYAVEASYGTPDDLKSLIDTAHGHGVMVYLDVVYNHFGPDGNYLSLYAPGFFTERHHTPWGIAVNYDGEHSRPVRDFAIHNALYWIEEYHLDGLRLDAVHAIIDDTTPHLLHELSVRARHATLNRPLHLVLENEENAASRLLRSDDGRAERYTAQWNDDVHHVLHVAASGEGDSYYGDYVGDTDKLGRALAQGFAFQGQVMSFRGSPRGEPSGELPPTAFVSFVQNHDQIGNRAFGDRLNAFSPPEAVKAVSAVCLLLPQVPMLFMGEEWGAATPFPFFCDFSGDLADAIRNGRREEFKHFPAFRDEAARDRIPDPTAASTFLAAKLDWDAVDPGALARTRSLLARRLAEVTPLVARMGAHAGAYEILGRGAVTVRWRTEDGAELRLDANLKADPQGGFADVAGREIWREGEVAGGRLDPWTVRWSVHDGV
jgi:maltooligosyltrehalose trehalohydrolase